MQSAMYVVRSHSFSKTSQDNLLPPAYVVRREGNTFTLLVCPQGGVPVSHNALQHFPEYHGAVGGVPVSHNALQHFPECHGAVGGYPARSSGGVPWLGGTLPGPAGGGTLARRGYPGWGVPWPGGGTQLGQHREYLLHGGWYASCVHAGGLSCLILLWQFFSV